MTATKEVTLADVEVACKEFDAGCAEFDKMMDALERDLEEVKRKHLPGLKRQANVLARRQSEGLSAVENGTQLFVKPRTLTLHGVQAGLAWSKGKLVFDDAETVMANIRRFRKDDAHLLIRKTEEPNVQALRGLKPVDLEQLGCRIEGQGDVPVFKRVAGEVEKYFDKLIDKLVDAMVASE